MQPQEDILGVPEWLAAQEDIKEQLRWTNQELNRRYKQADGCCFQGIEMCLSHVFDTFVRDSFIPFLHHAKKSGSKLFPEDRKATIMAKIQKEEEEEMAADLKRWRQIV